MGTSGSAEEYFENPHHSSKCSNAVSAVSKSNTKLVY